MSAAILFLISSEFRSTPLTDNITERKFKEVDEIDLNNIVNKKMSVLVWKFLDSVIYRDVKLSDDNAGSVKCKHVWDIGVQLECIKKALFIIENGGVHWLNNYPVHGWVLVTFQHHMITDNMNVKPPLFDPNSQRDHNYDIKAAPRTTLADLDFTASSDWRSEIESHLPFHNFTVPAYRLICNIYT